MGKNGWASWCYSYCKRTRVAGKQNIKGHIAVLQSEKEREREESCHAVQKTPVFGSWAWIQIFLGFDCTLDPSFCASDFTTLVRKNISWPFHKGIHLWFFTWQQQESLPLFFFICCKKSDIMQAASSQLQNRDWGLRPIKPTFPTVSGWKSRGLRLENRNGWAPYHTTVPMSFLML